MYIADYKSVGPFMPRTFIFLNVGVGGSTGSRMAMFTLTFPEPGENLRCALAAGGGRSPRQRIEHHLPMFGRGTVDCAW